MHSPILLSLLSGSALSAAVSLPISLQSSQTSLVQISITTYDTNNSTCDCGNTNSTGPRLDPPSICNDYRLGPVDLPRQLPLLSLVSDYDRFDGLTPGDFLAKWTNKTTGSYLYPEQNGYSLDVHGKAITGEMDIAVGTLVDRFGSEYGSYISAADAPFDQRSLPPSSLNTAVGGGDYPYGYHVYNVTRTLRVEGGPIAPWFGQPGLGAQFFIGGRNKTTILQLIDNGYLDRVHKRDISPGSGQGGGCGS